MLRPPSSLGPWPGARSYPCAKCGAPAAGIALGDRCPACAHAMRRAAARVGRWVAVGTSLPFALYVAATLPPDRTARAVAAAGVVIWYVLTTLIARRIALEWLK